MSAVDASTDGSPPSAGGDPRSTRTARGRGQRLHAFFFGSLLCLLSAQGTRVCAADDEPASFSLVPGVARGSVLTFRPPLPDGRSRTLSGNGWRHDFDIVLTADSRSRTVHDERGGRHRFAASGRDPDSSRSVTGGELRREGGRYEWHRLDGTHVSFVGSAPVRIETPDGRVRSLHYVGGQLRSVSDDGGPTLLFGYASGELRTLSLPDGTRWKIVRDDGGNPEPVRDDVVDGCGPSESMDEDACDTDASPPDPTFEHGAGIPGALRLDARPASCRSYFSDFVGTARGMAIEGGVGELAHYVGYDGTVRSFPIADFVGAELRVVRSRDLSLPTYGAPGKGLLERLLRDGEEIERHLLDPLARDGRVELRELGRTTTVLHEPNRPVVLELVVRHGLASPGQIAQMERARALLLARHGIVLRVIEIP